ncbi:MAG: UbiE/COQ5 family methyltransferase [candidate division TM6 bacterium GW2011_GWF2_38_10]|nr:MAG: UbiE/COQ5 family methyltransferase [candidate division TM6 bacterium GW2011_GWF2_38_10]
MHDVALSTYKKLSTMFYDLEDHIHNEQAQLFYAAQAQKVNGPLLEPMCGSGRFLLPLLKAGYDIEGFDASEHMIALLQQKHAQLYAKPAPAWVAFMQHFVPERLYNLIFIPYGSLGLLCDKKDLMDGLQRLRSALAPTGKLLLEIDTVASAPGQEGVIKRAVRMNELGQHVALTFRVEYDKERQLFKAHSRYDLLIDGAVVETEQEVFEQYLYRHNELEDLLHAVGFTSIKKYPAFDESAQVDIHTPIIIYECKN